MPPDIASILHVYDAVACRLLPANLLDRLEPIEHVAEVERLRSLYRPLNDVRVLIVGESHVRATEATFQRRGPAFLYNERYYTPWWKYLLLPAFAPNVVRTDMTIRLRLLKQMQALGVWVLDASPVSLSGYGKVHKSWSNRPFDLFKREIMRVSWQLHLSRLVKEVISQKKPPIVCAIGSVLDDLPNLKSHGTIRLNCINRANATSYCDPSYLFGTEALVQAVSRADSGE